MSLPGGQFNLPPDPRNAMPEKVRALEARLQRLETARTLESAAIGAGGVRIEDGGSLQVIDPTSGHAVAYLGMAIINDETPQMVVLLSRDDGTLALALADFGSGVHPHQQALQWWDRAGQTVVADDVVSNGLARPHLPLTPMQDWNPANWPQTTSTVFTTIALCGFERQNPYLTWSIQLLADSGATGQFRVLLNGTQLGGIQTVVGSSGSTQWDFTAALTPDIGFGDVCTLELQARRSAGSGSVYGFNQYLSGTQSP